jgi:hypothetical protein
MTAWAIFSAACIVAAWQGAPFWVVLVLGLGAVIAVVVDE